MNAPEPHPELRRLDALVGEWEMSADNPPTPDETLGGRMSFEWMDGAMFLGQCWSGEGPFPSGVSVTGWDEREQACVMHYFDDRGVARLYEISVSDGTWTMSRQASGEDDFSQRFIGTFGDDGSTIAGMWERSDDGSSWQHDFDLVYVRVAKGPACS